MKVKAVVACCATLAITASEAAVANEWMLNVGIEDFRWREFDGGAQLLEESGVRYSLGVGFESPVSPDALTVFGVEGQLYFGNVDYDGQAMNLQTGGLTPLKNETDYDGLKAEAWVAQHYPKQGGGALEVFGAAGVDTWTRDLKSTASVTGYTEYWTVFYGAGGVGWRAAAYALRAGVKLPLIVSEEVTLFNVDLEPEGSPSLFMRFSTTVHDGPRQSWSVGAYYDGYRFDESDPMRGVFQPESHQDVLGLQVTGRWR